MSNVEAEYVLASSVCFLGILACGTEFVDEGLDASNEGGKFAKTIMRESALNCYSFV
jgi:hypothetical protein